MAECEAKEAYTFYLVDRKLNVVTESGSGLLMANRTEEGKVTSKITFLINQPIN